MALDRDFFFESIRSSNFRGHLTQGQVNGLDAILDGWEARNPRGDMRWLAYTLATTFHETNETMTPVREAYWLSEDWRRTHLRYYPYYGRGYVQLTHKTNYAHAATVIGADLVAQPDLALRPDYAAVIMFVGMTEGWFRSDSHGAHTLERYFGHGVDDPVGARAIINGYEPGVPQKIAHYHQNFLAALRPAAAPAIALAPVEARTAAPVILSSFEQPAVAAAGARAAELRPGDAGAVELHRITADIVVAFLNKNTIDQAELPELVTNVFVALSNATSIVARAQSMEAPRAESDAGSGGRRNISKAGGSKGPATSA